MDKDDVFYEVARSQLEEQEQRRIATDSKAMRLVGLAVAFVGVAVIVLKDFSNNSGPLSCWSIGLAAAICVVALVIVGLVLWVLKPGTWARDPKLSDFLDAIRDPQYASYNFTEWAGRQFANAVEKNEKVLNMKLGLVKCSLGGLALLSLLLVSLVVTTRLQ